MKRKRHYTTYLAGPMQAVAHSGAGWRVFFTEMLKKYNVDVQNPVKSEKDKTGLSAAGSKVLIKKLQILIITNGDQEARRKFLTLLDRMVAYDFQMVRRCHFIIAQVIENVVSTGTQEEIMEASKRRIPVYVIYNGRPEYFPAWLLRRVLRSGGRVFLERKKNGFKECLNFLRNKWELEELEQGGTCYQAKAKKDKKAKRAKRVR